MVVEKVGQVNHAVIQRVPDAHVMSSIEMDWGRHGKAPLPELFGPL